eukprot:TRINITY_DN2143_c0_g2_i1.p1 TRINITY_DN2143_c0_g2~~TRINITY_DN2143_c0_g2_i1.p1  ORF type:complete len:482 (-),score=76.12 TRINITY_DN2143_c0_g2_i1:384-1829(-)
MCHERCHQSRFVSINASLGTRVRLEPCCFIAVGAMSLSLSGCWPDLYICSKAGASLFFSSGAQSSRRTKDEVGASTMAVSTSSELVSALAPEVTAASDEACDVASPSQASKRPRQLTLLPLACGDLAEASPDSRANLSGLTLVAECFQPLFWEVAEYAVHEPKAFARMAAVSRSVSSGMRVVSRPRLDGAMSVWQRLYAKRWPVFYEALRWQSLADSQPIFDWSAVYQETVESTFRCVLEVFDREKKAGFAMAAMPAEVSYDVSVNGYVAKYISARHVAPEVIDMTDAHRLRFCPESARSQLLVVSPVRFSGSRGSKAASSSADTPRSCASSCEEMPLDMPLPTVRSWFRSISEAAADLLTGQVEEDSRRPYCYNVLEGLEGLQAGMHIELQWKMQEKSPFGWWFGKLESIQRLNEPGLAHATILFEHFPATSRWYRLGVTFGDSQIRDCAFGGHTGGLRVVSQREKTRWMRFFPPKPVGF